MTAVEHLSPRSTTPGRTNDYSNCVYICRLCNGARSAKPQTDRTGRRLLDPTRVAWATHFHEVGYEIRPKPGDSDAEYTAGAYDLNAEPKVRARSMRDAMVGGHLDQLRDKGSRLASLAPIIESLALSNEPEEQADFRLAVRNAQIIQKDYETRWRAVRHYLGVPEDADGRCNCKVTTPQLPTELERQLVEIPDKG